MDNRNLGKLLGAVAEVVAAQHPDWDQAEVPVDELYLVRETYDRMHSWCESQMAALTELIEQHEQQAAAPLGK